MKQKVNFYLVSFFLIAVVLYSVFYDKLQSAVQSFGFDGDLVKWLLVVLILPLLKLVSSQYLELMSYQRKMFEAAVEKTLSTMQHELSNEVNELQVSVDKRFDDVDRRLGAMQKRQNTADETLAQLNTKMQAQDQSKCSKEQRSKDYDCIWENAKPYFDSFKNPDLTAFARMFKENVKSFVMDVLSYNLKEVSVVSLMEKLRNEIEVTERMGDQMLDESFIMKFEKALARHIDHYEISVHNTINGQTNDRVRSLHNISQTFMKDSLDCLFETYQSSLTKDMEPQKATALATQR